MFKLLIIFILDIVRIRTVILASTAMTTSWEGTSRMRMGLVRILGSGVMSFHVMLV